MPTDHAISSGTPEAASGARSCARRLDAVWSASPAVEEGIEAGYLARAPSMTDVAPWPSGKAADCKSAIRRFDSDRRLFAGRQLHVGRKRAARPRPLAGPQTRGSLAPGSPSVRSGPLLMEGKRRGRRYRSRPAQRLPRLFRPLRPCRCVTATPSRRVSARAGRGRPAAGRGRPATGRYPTRRLRALPPPPDPLSRPAVPPPAGPASHAARGSRSPAARPPRVEAGPRRR